VAYFGMRRDQVLRDASWAPWSQRAIVSRAENAIQRQEKSDEHPD